MAENTIDTLSLEIKSNAAQAQKSLEKLTDALIKLAGGTSRGLGGLRTAASDIRTLNDATKALNTEKLSAYATGLNDLSVSVGKFSNIGSKIVPAISALKQLSGINLSGLRVSGDFSGLSGLADIALKLSQIKAVDLNRALRAFEKIGAKDFSSLAQNLASLNGLDTSGFASLSIAAEQLAALGKKDLNVAIKNIEKMGAINFGGLVQGISSLAGTDFSKLAVLGQTFQSFSSSLSGADKISAGTTRIFESLSRISQSAANIPALTSALPGLSNSIKDLVSVLATAPSVSRGTVTLTSALSGIVSSGSKAQKAADALPAISSAIRGLIDSLASAPSVNSNIIKLIQSLSNFSQQGGRAGIIAGNLQGHFNALSGSAGRLQLSIRSISNSLKSFSRQLLSAMGIYLGLYGVVRGLQKSVKTFSDLVEIQNVVDKTFGNMTDKVEQLAKVSIPNFGMSELTVKNIASRYQAMGVAMGFAQDEMSDMSIELTKLAADMASFYNVEQDMVSEKLESIFTGTTRPLRTFGLDLSQATLQSWALKNGIDANVKSMNQMEKTLLRYQYVMAQTKFLSGDFRDTQLTMANQTRILAQSFEQLASVIGGVLVNAFKPLVISLNRAMQSIIAFAQTIANALGKIFGWTYEIKGGGIANDFEDAGAGAEDMADGTGAAKDNLKEMQKYIAEWHEVNNMTTSGNDTGGGKSGGGGAGGGDLGDAIGGQLVRTESLFDKYKSDIDSLYDLGKYISSVLSNAMESIDWNSIYKKADKFGRGLADFLNGLINPRLFENTGKTIAGSLNTALHFLDSFGTRFDWKNFGKSIAAGINGFFGTFDFSKLAHTINVWVKGILDTIITAIDKTDWKLVGEKIGTFLLKIDLFAIMGKVAKAIWKALNAAFDTYSKMFEVAPFETVLLSLATIPKLLNTSKIVAFVKSIATGTTAVINFGRALLGSQTALAALSSAGFPAAARAAAVLGDSLSLIVMGFSDMLRTGIGNGQFLAGISAAFANISENLTGTQKGVITAVSAFAEFKIVEGSVKDLVTGTGNLVVSILKIVGAVGAAGIALSAVFSFPAGAIAAGVIGLASALMGVKAAQDEIADTSSVGKFADSIDEVSEEVSRRTEQIKGDLSSIKEEVESVGDFQAERARKLADEYERLANTIYRTSFEEARMKDIAKELGEIIPGVSDYIDEQTGYLDIQRETLDDLINSMELYAQKQALQEMLTESYKAQYDAEMNVARAQEDMNKALEDFIKVNDGMSESVKNMIQEGDIQGLRDLKTQLWDVEQNSVKLAQAFGENATSGNAVNKMIDSLEQSMGGYAEVLSDAEETQADAVDTTNRLYDSIMENNAALSLQEEKNFAAVKSSDEYQRSVRNLTHEFSELGTTVSDEFLEKLALDETGMAESIIGTFTKMKEGVQLEAGELQTLFSNIAPGMSSGFISSLAEQEPQMQSQIAMTLASLSSGAQIPFEEMKTVFKTIGYELPDETISGLQEKAPFVQASVIGLLAEAKNGAGLIGPDLLAVFNAMGAALPTEMINSMQSMDGPTQAQVIELLGQLIAGCDMSADEVLQRFSEFGLAVPTELQNAIESGTTGVYLKGQDLLEELASAASPAERARILKEYNDLGEDVISNGLLAALNSKNESVRNEAGSLINQITSATTGEERDAAIAALNEFANDFVEEGFIGPIKTISEEKIPEVGKDSLAGYGKGMTDNLDIVKNAAGKVGDATEEGFRESLESHSPSRRMMPVGQDVLLGVVEGFASSIGEWTNTIISWADETFGLFDENINNTINSAADWFSNLPGMVYDSIYPMIDYVSSWGDSVFSEFDFVSNDTISSVANWFSALPGNVYDEIMNFVTESLPQWKDNINSFFDRTVPKIIKNVVHLFGDLKESLVPVGENLIKGLWDGIHGLTDWLGTKIGGFCRKVIDKFKEGFDEHSPSKEAFKIGDYFTLGLQKGFSERFSDVYGDVESFAKDITSIKINPPVLDTSIPVMEDYKPKFSDMGAIQSEIQMEMDAKMAQMAYENQRTQEMMEQIIDAIERKQLIVGDRDIFEANRRETIKFGRRTTKDPYPIYGRYK